MGTLPKQKVVGGVGSGDSALYNTPAPEPVGELGSDDIAVSRPNGDDAAVGCLPNARAALTAADPLKELFGQCTKDTVEQKS